MSRVPILVLIIAALTGLGAYMSQASPAMVSTDADGKPFPPLSPDSLTRGRQWSPSRTAEWYAARPWIAGANYVPMSASNELEMWQADTFDPKKIDREMALAEGIGFNAMRVFLHDLAWSQDPPGFFSRLDLYLQIASRHGISTMLVLFDSVWDPNPRVGTQLDPVPGRHNSRWLQSPGAFALTHASEYPRLERYAKEVVSRYAHDPRVLIWDIMNEPDNTNASSYGSREPTNKTAYAYRLMVSAFGWVREIGPDQPLTAGVWHNDWSLDSVLFDFEKLQLTSSDVITFHCYDPPSQMSFRITSLRRFARPIICTEYMARTNGSTFPAILPLLKKENVGAFNWGFVSGRSQTIYPWDSWEHAYAGEPKVWFHDIFRPDGTPYSAEETDLIKSLTQR